MENEIGRVVSYASHEFKVVHHEGLILLNYLVRPTNALPPTKVFSNS